MSRTMRGAMTVAQTALAGPSSRPFLRPPVPIPGPSYMARRPFMNKFIPTWLSRNRSAEREQKAKEKAAAEKPSEVTTSTSETTASGRASTSSTSAEDTKDTKEGEDEGGLYDFIKEEAKAQTARDRAARGKASEHRYTSGRHQISTKKLNLLSRQIAGLPVDEAIIQMQFSEKSAARWVMHNLTLARDHAVMYKGMRRELLIVSEAYVNKDEFGPKKIDIKGRGRHGIMRKPYCRMKYVIKEGKTALQVRQEWFTKTVDKLGKGAHHVREDAKLGRKMYAQWYW